MLRTIASVVADYRKAAKRTPAKPRPSMGSRMPASDEPVLEPLVDPELVAVEPEPAVELGLLLLPEGLPVLTVPFFTPVLPVAPEGTTTRVEPPPVAGTVATGGWVVTTPG